MQAAIGLTFIAFGMLIAGMGINFMMTYIPIMFFIWLVILIVLIINAVKTNKSTTTTSFKKLESIFIAGAFLISVPGCLHILLKTECTDAANRNVKTLDVSQCFWIMDGK